MKRYCSMGFFYRGVHHVINKTTITQGHENNIKSLCKHLDISESKIKYLSIKYPVINKLNVERIENLVQTIKEIGFSNKVLVEEPALFGILPITLKFRHKVLVECGVNNVSPALLTRYLTIIKGKTIAELKKSKEIPSHINVENRLASCMTQWPTSLTTLISEDVNNSTLYKLRLKIIQRYLELVFDLTNEEFHRGIETYPTVKHRPLEYINETLTILQSKIMIPSHKIKSNLYLIQADPENLKNLLYNVRTIGDIDIKEVIRMHPKLALKNSLTVLEIKKILEEYGISNEAQRRCFDIYTLGPDTVRQRLENAGSTPEFSIFFNHPRFLKIIHYKKNAMKRLSELSENNKKCSSLNVLSGSTAQYEVYQKTPGDRSGKGKDLLFCISQYLGKKYTQHQIGHMLKRHPFWLNIPVLQVRYMYDQLSKLFTDEDILDNCPILFYPWKKVKETLNLLENQKLHEQFSVIHENFNYNILSNSQKLSIILYILEKNHYFSGNGVWSDERNKHFEETNELRNKCINT